MAVAFEKMVLAGVGLICGSLGLDMRRRKLVKQIIGFGRSEANLRTAKKMGLIDNYFLRDDEFPPGVDFLMMGTPVQTIVPLTEAFLPRLEPGCIISDVGSVKGDIVRGMRQDCCESGDSDRFHWRDYATQQRRRADEKDRRQRH